MSDYLGLGAWGQGFLDSYRQGMQLDLAQQQIDNQKLQYERQLEAERRKQLIDQQRLQQESQLKALEMYTKASNDPNALDALIASPQIPEAYRIMATERKEQLKEINRTELNLIGGITGEADPTRRRDILAQGSQSPHMTSARLGEIMNLSKSYMPGVDTELKLQDRIRQQILQDQYNRGIISPEVLYQELSAMGVTPDRAAMVAPSYERENLRLGEAAKGLGQYQALELPLFQGGPTERQARATSAGDIAQQQAAGAVRGQNDVADMLINMTRQKAAAEAEASEAAKWEVQGRPDVLSTLGRQAIAKETPLDRETAAVNASRAGASTELMREQTNYLRAQGPKPPAQPNIDVQNTIKIGKQIADIELDLKLTKDPVRRAAMLQQQKMLLEQLDDIMQRRPQQSELGTGGAMLPLTDFTKQLKPR